MVGIGRSELLRRVLSAMHQRIMGAAKGVAEVAEQPLRNVGRELRQVAGGTDGKDKDLAREYGWGDSRDQAGAGPRLAEPTRGSAAKDAPLIVADELHRIHLSGAKATWTNFLPRFIPVRKFEAWILSKTEGPLPPLSPDSGYNCREMILWAAAKSNVLTHAQLRKQYASLLGRKALRFRKEGFLPDNFPQKMQQVTLPHERRAYNPADSDSPRPQRGDLIMWEGWGEGNAHTAMATGRLIGPDRDAEVYSFWPPPKGEAILGTQTDAVQITTVNALTPYVEVPGVPPLPIWFGRGPW
ncbi:hypothetical protein [Nocardia sp. KC 131]|uniref:hypothetical protein n=1 Tax=Nocardia arseniciresistens TaxID=3392119 RepID=UPI00398EDA74